jgi:hypothetical protein
MDAKHDSPNIELNMKMDFIMFKPESGVKNSHSDPEALDVAHCVEPGSPSSMG